MARKKQRDTNGSPEVSETHRPNYMASAGGGMILLGGFVIAAMKFGGVAAPGWVIWAGLALAVCGGILWYLSGLPKEQSIEWVRSLVYALSIALIIRWGIAEPYRIPSGSMEPTLHGDPKIGQGDRVWVNKWVYGLRVPFMNHRLYYGQDPQRFDIVVFKTVEENSEHPTLVKRIIGLPGERVQIQHDGTIEIDGKTLALSDSLPPGNEYTTYGKYGVLSADEYAVVPEGHYLMLGDNSGSSRDGRAFGWLPNEHIVGRVASIWWPPPRWRDFTGFSQTLWWKSLLALLAAGAVFRLFIGRSWAVPAAVSGGVDHLLVLFIAVGLRIPFTPWWLLRWAAPRRGDRVIYRPPAGAPRGVLLAGRVAGLPGESVEIVEGVLTVNGEPVRGGAWPGNARFADGGKDAIYGKDKKHRDVPAGHCFILGEHPDDEEDLDGRVLGWIPLAQIDAKAVAIWWPLIRRKA